MANSPSYFRVFLTFARNSVVRDMTFRANFILDMITSMSWVFLNLAFYTLIFRYTPMIGQNTAWREHEFFLFFATVMIVNTIVQAVFMTNADDLTDMIRTGNLDFLLLKPIDTQFLVSVRRIEWSSLGNLLVAVVLLIYSLVKMHYMPGVAQWILYPVYVACGVAIYYSLMILLASSTIWMGRNLTLFDFWFYITNFSRYPMEIYNTGPVGIQLRRVFTYAIPVLIAVNVPARILVPSLTPRTLGDWVLPLYAILAAVGSLFASRWVFHRALASYRSASS